jgi:hypothetical protein
MRNLRLHHPSPALVLSVIALFVALGGTGYAAIVLPANSVGKKHIKRNAVTTAKIKRNAVTTAKVKNGSLRSADFKASELPTGPTGATGPKGDKGDKGDTGTNFVIRESAPTAVAAGATGSATAQCLSGERASGGGDDVSGAGETGTVVIDSQPTTTAAIPSGWTVKVVNATLLTGPGAPSSVVAKVICAGP